MTLAAISFTFTNIVRRGGKKMEFGKYDKETHKKMADEVISEMMMKAPLRVGPPDGPNRYVEAR